ncbi:30S ribosomal protein S2 [Candidatus Microgenomates bacterium]|nr:30S ribosomal protein S2 [Candidatus Microgenomates bacterium]
MSVNVTLEELLEAGAHFGHQARRWNPKMAQYLYGVKDGVHVFDLAKTKEALDIALDVLAKYAKEGKSILIVGTKKQAKDRVKELAENTDIAFLNERWLGGTLTNFNQVLNSAKKLLEIEEGLNTGKYSGYTKKERLLLERDAAKLRRNVGGVTKMLQKPDLIIVIDTHREVSAVKEAKKVGVVTIGVVDSNADPDMVTYPIPMNDDASKSLEYVLGVFEKTLLEAKGKNVKKETGKKETKKVKAEEKEEEFHVAE